jgi:hypothetical protein
MAPNKSLCRSLKSFAQRAFMVLEKSCGTLMSDTSDSRNIEIINAWVMRRPEFILNRTKAKPSINRRIATTTCLERIRQKSASPIAALSCETEAFRYTQRYAELESCRGRKSHSTSLADSAEISRIFKVNARVAACLLSTIDIFTARRTHEHISFFLGRLSIH